MYLIAEETVVFFSFSHYIAIVGIETETQLVKKLG
jgi:hypothetical protein